jgi:hypothetical protein
MYLTAVENRGFPHIVCKSHMLKENNMFCVGSSGTAVEVS